MRYPVAEFCLPCWNKLNDLTLKESEAKISKDLVFCEGCADLKKIILKIK